jgi:hypothetical protein
VSRMHHVSRSSTDLTKRETELRDPVVASSRVPLALDRSDFLVIGRGVQTMGEAYTPSGVCQGSANHRLSVRRRIAKAQKGLPRTDYSALRASPLCLCSGPPCGLPFGRSPPLHGVVTAARSVTRKSDQIHGAVDIAKRNGSTARDVSSVSR